MEGVRVSSEFDEHADVVLYEGDCLDLLTGIPNKFMKLVVTSPPYNLGKSYETRLDMDEYAFMFYDMAKFQYFFNENKADVGVEIVPCHDLKKNRCPRASPMVSNSSMISSG